MYHTTKLFDAWLHWVISSDKPIVSLTTDIWSCSSNDTSLLCLTAHWLEPKPLLRILRAQALEMANTRQEELLLWWKAGISHRDVFT